MAIVKQVDFKITGQVPDDWDDNNYQLLEAELRMICAKHKLTIE